MLTNKQYISIAVMVLLVGIVGAGIIYWQASNLVSLRQTGADNQALDRAEADALNRAYAEARKTDADLDGLSDEEEMVLGTDINNPDTDKDGLLDVNESLYKTDPLKADTDGDGKDDGYEVRRGLNPTGPGKIIINQ